MQPTTITPGDDFWTPENFANLLKARADFAGVVASVGNLVIGQEDLTQRILSGMVARGHVLLTSPPGLAKTMIIRALGKAIYSLGGEGQFLQSDGRVQCTPGMKNPWYEFGIDRETGKLVATPSKLLKAYLCLLDEINRTPPKNQALMLEPMQEHQVTAVYGGVSEVFRTQEPFFVLGTRNPIEQEGTYALPEAQLDRFMFESGVLHPTAKNEAKIALDNNNVNPNATDVVLPVMSVATLLSYQELTERIPIAPQVVAYAVALVQATRPESPSFPRNLKVARRGGGKIKLDKVLAPAGGGASVRGSQALIRGSRGWRLVVGQGDDVGSFHVTYADMQAVARLALKHRLVRTSVGSRVDPTEVVEAIIRHVPVDGAVTADVVEQTEAIIAPTGKPRGFGWKQVGACWLPWYRC